MATFNLTWTPATGPNAGQQRVQYRIKGTSTWTIHTTLGSTVNSYSGLVLADNTLYQFAIVNLCLLGNQIYSQIFEGIKFICPVVTLTPGVAFINFSFPHLGGSIDKYDIEIYDASFVYLGKVTKYPATTITGTLNNLTPNTSYNIKVKPYAEGYVKSDCAYSNDSTLVSPTCSAASDLSAVLS